MNGVGRLPRAGNNKSKFVGVSESVIDDGETDLSDKVALIPLSVVIMRPKRGATQQRTDSKGGEHKVSIIRSTRRGGLSPVVEDPMGNRLRGKLSCKGDTLVGPTASTRCEPPPLAPLGLLVDEFVVKKSTEQSVTFSTRVGDVHPRIGAPTSLMSGQKHEETADPQLGNNLGAERSNNGSPSEDESVNGLQSGEAASLQTEREDDVTNENFKNLAGRGSLLDKFNDSEMKSPGSGRLRHDGSRWSVNPESDTLHGGAPSLFDPVFEASLVKLPAQRLEILHDVIEAPAEDIGIINIRRQHDATGLQTRSRTAFDKELVVRVSVASEPRRKTP
jgi:hypothetical protein